MAAAAADERFEQAAQLRDALKTIETLRTRQQKMARPELRRPRRLRPEARPGGRRRADLPDAARPRRRAHRAGDRRAAVPGRAEGTTLSGTRRSGLFRSRERPRSKADRRGGRPPGRRAAVLRRSAAPRRRSTCPSPLPGTPMPTCSSAGCRAAPGRRVRIVVPRRGEKRGLLDLASRNAQLAYQARFNENVAAHYDALETLRAVLALPALPRRIECFDVSTIQGSETVASMVVCEDGRMKPSEYRKFRIRGAGGRTPRRPSAPLGCSTIRHGRCARSWCGATAGCSSGRAVPRPDPDRRRQGAALRGLRGARGSRARDARGVGHRQERGAAVHARPRRAGGAPRPTARRCCSSGASATKRTGSP
jgi:hypothetical protein